MRRSKLLSGSVDLYTSLVLILLLTLEANKSLCSEAHLSKETEEVIIYSFPGLFSSNQQPFFFFLLTVLICAVVSKWLDFYSFL